MNLSKQTHNDNTTFVSYPQVYTYFNNYYTSYKDLVQKIDEKYKQEDFLINNITVRDIHRPESVNTNDEIINGIVLITFDVRARNAVL